MLRDVNVVVEDGLLGFATPKGTGIFCVIGASQVEWEKPIVITGNMGASKIKERLGHSPLADKVMDMVENGSNWLYCMPVKASVPGTVGTVEKSGTGKGSITVTGEPYNSYDVKITFTGKGGMNTAMFTYSIDGAVTTSEEITVPLSGTYEIPKTNLTIGFTEDTMATDSFEVGDEYSFSTVEPMMANAEVLTVIDYLKYYDELYEGVAIVGESGPAMWAAISAAQRELEADFKKPLWFTFEAPKHEDGESVEDYALRLVDLRKQINNYNIQICAARSLYVRMDGTTRDINNMGITIGLYSRAAVHQSIARTRDSAGMGIKKSKMLELRPAGIEEYISILDDASYLTFREFAGLDDYFVNQARMACPAGSDYRYAEDTRVLCKIIRDIRKAALPFLNEDIDVTDTQGELERRAKYLGAPLDDMIEAGEISAYEITVPEGQDIIMTERWDVVVRYVSKGYLREIWINVGRANVTV